MAHMKSPLGVLEQAYAALFRDAAAAYPELRTEFRKDFETLVCGIENKGLHLLMVDLPAADKHFCRCLAQQAYIVSGLPLTKRVSKHVQIPAFLRGLYLRVFDRFGRLLPDPDIEAIIFIRQFYCLAKKVAIDCPARKKTAAIADFVSVDTSNPLPDGFWDQDALGVADVRLLGGFVTSFRSAGANSECLEDVPICLERPSEEVWRTADITAAVLVGELGSFRSEIADFKHGPGVVSNIPRFSSKFCWEGWDVRLDREFPLSDCGYHSYPEWATCESQRTHSSRVLPESRMYCVPKTYKGPRLIAAEPVERMWCQQSIWHFIETRAEKTLIGMFCRFRDQKLNQALATKGSLDRSLVTVDLSAASDRVSCCLVQSVFRGNPTLLLALQATRTTHVDLSKCSDAHGQHKLSMYSTMGNACTFPVETICFLTLALTAVLVTRGLKPTKVNIASLTGELAVFGDDIIVPKDSWELLQRMLISQGLKINLDKTFSEGNFRESCGVDAYNGVDVTPVYLKHLFVRGPESVLGTTESGNHALQRGLFHLSAYLRSMVDRRIKLPVVPLTSAVTGHKSFVVKGVRGFRRANLDLQRIEVRLMQPTGRIGRMRHSNWFNLLQYFTERPSPSTRWTAGYQIGPAIVTFRPRWVSEHLCLPATSDKESVG